MSARNDAQREALARALRRTELSLEELWMRYFALGGTVGLVEVEAFLHDMLDLPDGQRDVLAHAVNERLDELTWVHRVPYSRTTRDSTPRSEPLAALVRLLDGVHMAPSERLGRVVQEAGRALGVGIAVYLVDYEQCSLHPLAPHDGGPLDVDTTLAGRAFRSVQILSSETGPAPRLWVPLLDGVERVGVLGVRCEERDLHDPGLRTQCRWVSRLIGHLVTILSQYGDGLEVVRMRRPRTRAAELIWSLLPPLTAGTDSFVVTGLLEPCHRVGGDAFDYALSETTASLALFDATAHDSRGGLIAATALGAYRSARRAGHGLFEQARVVDEAIQGHFGQDASAAAVLAEVDLGSGRIRYLNAGHRDPLVLRAGRVVRHLDRGRRPRLGHGEFSEITVGEEVLEPDDWLVVYTDGIVEARDEQGHVFGDTRLVDFLRREAAAGHAPPETARRLVRAVLAHQDGRLEDDATVLLARWTSPASLSP